MGSQVKNVVIQRDIWGTLLAAMMELEISIALAFSYPFSFYLLHKMTNVPEMYGNISNMVLETITNNNKLRRVDIIFDIYPDGPSIKDHEHKIRNILKA